MRVLAIETSTSRAQVALLEEGRVVLARTAPLPNQSAEQLLPLIAQSLAETGWAKSELSRIGVAVGPGSFTGLRVGIACAQGLALGLGIPIVGVTSLRAMARMVPGSVPGLRCPVLDARRAEVFAGAYQAGPLAAEVLAPLALSAENAHVTLSQQLPEPIVWIGSGLALAGMAPTFSGAEAQEPSATAIGLLAGELSPEMHPPVAVYVRDAGATLPDLGAPARH